MVFAGDTRVIKGMIAVDKKCQKYTSYPLTATAVVLGQLWAQTRRPSSLPPAGAGGRASARGKRHEEGGLTYAKAGSSLRSPPGNP